MALEVRDGSSMNVVGEAAHEQTLARYRDYVTTSFVAAVEPISIGKAEGATVACGGHRLTGAQYDKGCFFAPTVLTGVTNAMRVAREETAKCEAATAI